MKTDDKGALDWRPRADLGIAQMRAELMNAARDFFRSRKILEIDAPALSSAAVSDIHINSIGIRSALDTAVARYLHTSPEYAMKRMLAAGFPDIYFLGKVYRDGEAGQRHQPEFTLVEWYRLGYDLASMMTETEQFVAQMLGRSATDASPQRLRYVDAFQDRLGLDPFVSDLETLANAAGADQDLRRALGDDRDAWLDLLLATRLTATFPDDRLTTIYRYPASQAALARLTDPDERTAERFEIFAGTLELANGYVELADANEQRGRFDADLARRKETGRPLCPLDERFLAALESGLPDCAGVAVGFDRLLMLRAGATDIRDVRHFCWETA